MNFLSFIVLASLYVHTGSSVALSGNTTSSSGKNYTTDELGTCPINSSISVKVFRNLEGEWLTTFVARNKLRNFTRSMDLNLEKNFLECGDSRYITISGFLKDADADDFSGVSIRDSMNTTYGQTNDCCKRSSEFLTAADLSYMNDTLKENHMEAMKSSDRMQNIEDRLSGLDSTLADFKKNQTSFENNQSSFENNQSSFSSTQSSFAKRLTSIENTLKTIERTVDQLNNNMAYIPLPCQMKFDNVYKGKNVELSDGFRTAKRKNPSDYEYGGVMTSQPLKDEELFEIIIEETLDLNKYNGIAFGIIHQKSSQIQTAQSIFYRIKGTVAIFSTDKSTLGKSYAFIDNVQQSFEGSIDTRQLKVGTRLGLKRRCNGKLHFYLNGEDKGSFFYNVWKPVYGFVDILREVTKIRILS